MIILFFVIGGIVLFFLIGISILVALDTFRPKTDPSATEKTVTFADSLAKKILFIFMGLLTLICVTALIVHIARQISFKDIAAKAEAKQKALAWARAHMPELLNTDHPPPTDNSPPLSSDPLLTAGANTEILLNDALQEQELATHITPETPGTQKLTGETALFNTQNTLFEPSTTEFSSPDEAPPAGEIFTRLDGARPGDIYICTFFDQMENGAFTRSPKASYAQPSATSKNYITLDMLLPKISTEESVQVPLLMTGEIIPDCTPDSSLLLDENGRLKATRDIPAQRFSYRIRRTKNATMPKLHVDQTINTWLQKEFLTLPPAIKTALMSIRTASDETKLSSVATILNTYFGYESGAQTLHLPPGQTWNTLLAEQIKTQHRLIADCDILSTYAFIYLKFLGYHPALLIGYINSAAAPDRLCTYELHATLYVKIGSTWSIFEPTGFTPTVYTQTSPSARPRESNNNPGLTGPARSTDISAPFIQRDNIIAQTTIPYFTPPPALMPALRTISDQSLPDAHLAQTIAELLLITTATTTDPPPETTKVFDKDLLFEIVLVFYFVIIALIKFLSIISAKPVRLFPFPRPFSIMFIMTIGIACGYALAGSLDNNIPTWQIPMPISTLGITLACAGSLITIFGIFLLILPARPSLQKLKKHSFIIAGTLTGLSATLYIPSITTLICFCSSAIITITGLFLEQHRRI